MPSKTHHRPDSPYWSAELLIMRHGDDAIDCAEKEMNDCQASGDGDCYLAWGRICDAIVELQATQIASKALSDEASSRSANTHRTDPDKRAR